MRNDLERTNEHGLTNLNILVAEDDELNQRMMHVLLSRGGHRVEVVPNVLEALEAVKTGKFDLVFMDLHMPIMDGFEACRRIRAWENGASHIPVVALTASYVMGNERDILDAGMDDYILKPFELRNIERVLKSCMDGVYQPPNARKEKEIPMDAGQPNQLLDYDGMISRFGKDADLYKELLGDFVQGLPHRVENLERYFETVDWQSLSREAHNLKGIAAGLGAMQLSELARQLEDLSSYNNRAEARNTLDQLKNNVIALSTDARVSYSGQKTWIDL